MEDEQRKFVRRMVDKYSLEKTSKLLSVGQNDLVNFIAGGEIGGVTMAQINMCMQGKRWG